MQRMWFAPYARRAKSVRDPGDDMSGCVVRCPLGSLPGVGGFTRCGVYACTSAASFARRGDAVLRQAGPLAFAGPAGEGQLGAIGAWELCRSGSPAPCHPVFPVATLARNGHGRFGPG